MIQKASEFSTQQLGQQLAQTLGQPLWEQELSNDCKIEILESTPGKRFCQTADATVGIYIILAGKARLLDRTDNLIASVGVGDPSLRSGRAWGKGHGAEGKNRPMPYSLSLGCGGLPQPRPKSTGDGCSPGESAGA